MSEHYSPEQYQHVAPKAETPEAEPQEMAHQSREALLRNQMEMIAAVKNYGAATAENRSRALAQQGLTQESFVLAR